MRFYRKKRPTPFSIVTPSTIIQPPSVLKKNSDVLKAQPEGTSALKYSIGSMKISSSVGKTNNPNVQRLVPMDASAEREFDAKPSGLKQFFVTVLPQRFEPNFSSSGDQKTSAIEGNHEVQVEFDRSPKCSDFEYRQYIRGHILCRREGAVIDRGDLLDKLPEGRLTSIFQEDGDISKTPVNYGHRDQPPSSVRNIKDQYTNAKGKIDQNKGCKYEASDHPFAFFSSQSGDIWDIDINFMGEIQQKGKPIQQKYWTTLQGKFTVR